MDCLQELMNKLLQTSHHIAPNARALREVSQDMASLQTIGAGLSNLLFDVEPFNDGTRRRIVPPLTTAPREKAPVIRRDCFASYSPRSDLILSLRAKRSHLNLLGPLFCREAPMARGVQPDLS